MNKNKEFSKLVQGMDIPELRKDVNQSNLKWFLRNAAIRNRNHPNIDKAIDFAKKNLIVEV